MAPQMLKWVSLFNKHVAVSLLAAALWLCVLLVLMPAEPVIDLDTAGYLRFSRDRTAGYPLFLELVGVGNVLWVQPVLAVLALGFLGYQTSRLIGSALIAGVLMLSIAMNQPLFVHHYMVLTESLFVSLNMVLIGLMMKSAIRPSRGTIAVASAFAGFATTVRPVGIFLLPTLLVQILLVQLRSAHNRLALMVAAILPFVCILGIAFAIATARHGEAVPSLLPRVLFAKAAMIGVPETHTETPNPSPAERALANDFAPVRELVADAPDFATERFVAVAYENCVLWACSAALDLDPAAPDAYRAAWTRITRNPHAYFALTWRHYRSLWTMYAATHPAASQIVADYIREHRPLPFEAQVPALVEPLPAARFAVIVQSVVMAIGIATLGLALVGVLYLLLRRPLPAVGVVATTTALGVHGGLLLTALTGLGIPRYFLALWPLMMTSLVCGAWWIIERHGPRSLRDWFRHH